MPLEQHQNPINQVLRRAHMSSAMLIVMLGNRVLQQVKQKEWQQQEQIAHVHPSDSTVRPSSEPAGSS